VTLKIDAVDLVKAAAMASGAVTGLGAGAATSAAFSGIHYGLSNNFRNATHQQVIKYGFEHSKGAATVRYIARNYGMQGNYVYRDAPTNPFFKGSRGQTLKDGTMEIYRDAFFDPGTGEFDPTAMISVMDHEGGHLTRGDMFMLDGLGRGLSPRALTPNMNSPVANYAEAQIYMYQLSEMAQYHGYSLGEQSYLTDQFIHYFTGY
jgi:hypothetical protein